MKIGIVTSKFNREFTEKLESSALERLLQKGIKPDQITQILVPGAVEIPLACKLLLQQGYAGIITLGAVIRGETTHYELVCNSVERGVTQLMLETGKPIAFGVITTENEEQAWARIGGAHGNKGTDAADVLLEMLTLEQALLKKSNTNK